MDRDHIPYTPTSDTADPRHGEPLIERNLVEVPDSREVFNHTTFFEISVSIQDIEEQKLLSLMRRYLIDKYKEEFGADLNSEVSKPRNLMMSH